MSTTAIVVIVVVVIALIVIIAGVFVGSRRRRAQQERQEEARREYGPEYERTAERLGSERKAEQDLRERREKVEGEVRPLPEESRQRYEERWEQVERTFVDDPASSLNDADLLVREILEERNFPVGSREETSGSVGVMHPQVVEDFREAQRTRQATIGSGEEEPDLEKMRQAIRQYRSVYQRLIRG